MDMPLEKLTIQMLKVYNDDQKRTDTKKTFSEVSKAKPDGWLEKEITESIAEVKNLMDNGMDFELAVFTVRYIHESPLGYVLWDEIEKRLLNHSNQITATNLLCDKTISLI